MAEQGGPGAAEAALRAAARGVIGAMAMSGLRQAATALDLVHKTPPESVLERTTPRLFHRVPKERRAALVELVHWLYGAGGGALFGVLPRSVRRRPWAGPAYGVAVWGAFEAGIAPLLGLPRKPDNTPVERLTFLADHVLYGVVVASSPWPHRD
ncbi:hypothetical protein HNP84_008993 [Thermocatellispora tengchongensis]|uniref:DUF1440 domain-containing protein n=1 Tax=Thermocatellispora tengchongensis TaxID=1073253 RepID=A0A840PNF5_9ACTN|nr:hypothetical protein [Thermocatellispora tengchongensis]MBB5139230.1 hypothetical protein [Thermocatellispora tengchongensis]